MMLVKLVKLAVYRPVAMAMVILFILIIGMVSLWGLAIDLFPDLEYPIAAIAIEYPGVGPEEIENLVTAPLENILGTLANIEKISSTSRLGGALIILEFNWGTDMNVATMEIRERLDLLRPELPADLPAPSVFRFDPRTLPIIQLAIASEEYDLIQLKRVAEQLIKPSLDSLQGVAAVSITGAPEQEIRVMLNREYLSHYGLSLDYITRILRAENLNLPGGLVIDRGLEIPLRVIGQVDSREDLEELAIPVPTGEIVFLKEIAHILETEKRATTVNLLNGQPSIGITLHKESDANTVQVARAVNRTLKQLEKELPASVSVVPIFDQAVFINQSIRTVVVNMLAGSLLAGLVLYLFLRHIGSTLIVALAIPLSVLTAFSLIYFSNQTLNLLTMGGLALGVGMMVDNAIVILENIYRFHQQGFPLKRAAIRGTTEIGRAVIASALTTVIVFLPIVFVDGLAAQLFKPLALSVTYALLASLITALIIVPLLSSQFGHRIAHPSRFQRGFGQLTRIYSGWLHWALDHPKKVIGIVILLIMISFIGIPFLGTEFLPELDQNIVYLNVRLPVGSSLASSLALTEEVDRLLEDIPEITNSYVQVGGVGQFQVAAGTLSNRSNYQLQLMPVTQRTRSDKEIAEEVRNRLKHLPGVRVQVSAGDTGLGGPPIYLQIRGRDPHVLQSLAEEVTSLVSTVRGVREVESDFSMGQPEIQVRLDRLKAAQYGFTSAQIAQKLNEAVSGVVAAQISRHGESINIRLMLGNDESDNQLARLKGIELDSPLGMKVPLETLVTFQEELSPHTIKRSDRIREVAVYAQLLDRDLGSTIKEIREKLENQLHLPSGYSIHFGGQNEQMMDAFGKLTGAIILGVVLVYLTLAAQFESFFYPFIIMFTVPLTIIGIIPGLLLSGHALGVSALVGVLILTGIVVNQGIIFVDYVNTLRKKGKKRREALLLAGPIRLRPILMTTLTTIIGLLPLMFGFGEGAEIQAPMATVIIFGLSCSTFLSLIFIPVIYLQLDEWRDKARETKEPST